MRHTFRHHIRLTEEELRKLWQQALFSFDTSVLLNVYGYSTDVRENLVVFFETNADRIRVPHQFAFEYCRDRRRTIIKQIRNYCDVEKKLSDILGGYISPQRDHPYLTNDGRRAYDFVLEELAESRSAMENLLRSDEYCDRILKAFEGKVGNEPSAAERDELHKRAADRYQRKIPPGYLDKDKDPPNAYGDYVGWSQLMQIAQREKRPAILVTDDLKADWWYWEDRHRLGPRVELLEEFAAETGQELCLYKSDNFLRSANKFMGAAIREHVILEISGRLDSLTQLDDLDLKLMSTEPGATEDKQVEDKSVEKPDGDLKPASSDIQESDPDKLTQ